MSDDLSQTVILPVRDRLVSILSGMRQEDTAMSVSSQILAVVLEMDQEAATIEYEHQEDGIHVRAVDTATGVGQMFRVMGSKKQNAASAAYKRSLARLINAAAAYLEERS